MKPRRHEKGQGLVELALLLPVLMLIVMGVVDLGRVFFAYTGVVNAAREGAMCASLGPTCAGGYTSMVAAELGGSLSGVTATRTPTVNGPAGSAVTVTVSYTFRPVTLSVFSQSTFPLRASATMVVQ